MFTVPMCNESADDIGEQLRDVIVQELTERGLAEPERLAESLSVGTGTARAMLRRRSWTFEDAIWIVSTLGLPIKLTVVRTSTAESEHQVVA